MLNFFLVCQGFIWNSFVHFECFNRPCKMCKMKHTFMFPFLFWKGILQFKAELLTWLKLRRFGLKNIIFIFEISLSNTAHRLQIDTEMRKYFSSCIFYLRVLLFKCHAIGPGREFRHHLEKNPKLLIYCSISSLVR